MFLLFVWLGFIVLGFIFHNSRKVTFCQMIFSILLMGLSSGTADYLIYEKFYSYIIGNPREILSVNWLLKSFYFLTGRLTSYQAVVFSSALAGIILLYYAIRFYTKSTALVFALYMISPFVIDATQMKNFLAMSVWLWFSRYIVCNCNKESLEKKNVGSMKYLLGVFLAGSIHTAFFITIIFVILPYINARKLLIATFAADGLVLSLSITKLLDKLVNQIAQWNFSITDAVVTKYKAYQNFFDAAQVKTRTTLMVIFFLIVLFVYLLIGLKGCVCGNVSAGDRVKLISGNVWKLNIMVLLFIPLLFFSLEFYRMQRNILVLDYIAVTGYISSNIIEKSKLKVFSFILTVCICSMAGYYLYIDAILWNNETVFWPLFRF